MEKFKTGNIVKICNNIVIINKYRTIENNIGKYEVVDWIDFTHPNSSGSTRVKAQDFLSKCYDCSTNDGYKDEDCETCNGSGFYHYTDPGLTEAVLLAQSGKDYIIKKILKDFDF